MRHFLFYCCLLLFCIQHIHAQQPSFNLYTPADGLIDARVQKIFQDSRGMLYFLTRDGFCSFDGQRFQHYTQYNDQPVSMVYDIAEEKDGSLLIAAFSGLYRMKEQRFSKDTALSRIIREPGHILKTGPYEWIILAADGSYLYRNGQAQPLRITENGQPARPLLLEQAVCNGPLIAGLRSLKSGAPLQLVVYDLQTNKLFTPGGAGAPTEIVQYASNIYLKNEGSWYLLKLPADNSSGIALLPLPFPSGAALLHFYADDAGNAWFFNNDMTATYMRKSTGERTRYTAADGFPVTASHVFCDREKNYWFMVEGKGVYKLVHSAVTPFSQGFTQGQVQSVSIAPDNTVCIRSNSDLYLLNGQQSFQRKINTGPGLIQTLFFRNKWYAFYNDGFLETEDGRRIRFASFTKGTRQVSARITFDKKGRILTAGDFLAVIANDTLVTSIPLPYFTDNIAVDDNNNYWCFARDGSITAYTLRGNTLVKAASFSDNTFSTRYALHWGKDSFCIGTRNHGIIIVSATRNDCYKKKTIDTRNGLSNNFITCLLKMNAGQLIAATVTGLDRIHFTGGDIAAEQLFSRTGMFTGVPALVRNGASSLLALTDRGEMYLYTTEENSSQTAGPSLFFNAILVNGTAVDISQPVTLPYNRNNLRIIVSAPGFTDEKNIRFTFSINGHPTANGTSSRTGEADFSNLPPGHYTVSVTALFPGNAIARKTIQYSFRISKPFWKTAGFIAGLTAFILLLIYTLFRIQLRRRLHRKQIELEKEKAIATERSRIASDMHDDLGAGISTIKYLSQAAPFIAPEVQKENNQKISEQADALVDKMNDIIWAMNEKNDTLDNLVFYTKAWVANYLEPFQKKVMITIPQEVPPIIIRGEKRQHIFLCVKEAVHNIIKHAEAETIRVTMTLQDHHFCISIMDDGKGFDTENTWSGNGLSNMRKRMKAINGTFRTTGTGGTTITLEMPL